MIFNRPLDQVFGQQSKVKILRYLSLHNGQFTGREIAKATGLTHPTCHLVLSRLREQGIVLMRKSGNALLYSLNADHQITKNIIFPVFKKEAGLKQKMAQSLIKGLRFPVESVILFGSIVHKREKPVSDVDVLVVVPDKIDPEKAESKIISQGTKLIKEFGNQVSPLVINLKDFLKKLEAGDKLLTEILRQGQVIYGKSITDLISYAKYSR